MSKTIHDLLQSKHLSAAMTEASLGNNFTVNHHYLALEPAQASAITAYLAERYAEDGLYVCPSVKPDCIDGFKATRISYHFTQYDRPKVSALLEELESTFNGTRTVTEPHKAGAHAPQTPRPFA